MEVEWFERDISGGEERRIFKAWKGDEELGDAGPEAGKVYTFNSTELRMLHVEMVPVPPVGGVPLATVQPATVRPAASAGCCTEGARDD